MISGAEVWTGARMRHRGLAGAGALTRWMAVDSLALQWT